MKDGYNVLSEANETITVTDLSDTAMGESKPENETEASDDIFDDPIFKDPAERLETINNNQTLPNKNITSGEKRLSNLTSSEFNEIITVQSITILILSQ